MNLKTSAIALALMLMFASNAFSQSIDDAIKKAQSENKKVLLIFYSLNDSWSQKLDKEVLTYQEAIGQMVNFVVLRIDGDSKNMVTYEGKEYPAKDLSSKFSLTGYPSFVFLGADGNPIQFKYDGETVKSLSGYLDASDFVAMLKFFAQNKQADTDLSTVLGN